MKVLLVNGSPREGNTYLALKGMEKILNEENIETTVLSVKDHQIKECVGCYRCVTDGRHFCPLKNDDVESIWAEFRKADGVVLSAPVFTLGVPGTLKKFMDRIASTAHRPEFYNKPLVLLSTTAGMGTQDVFKQLSWFEIAGLRIVSKIGLMAYPVGKDTEKALKAKKSKLDHAVHALVKEMRSSKIIKPRLIQVIQFYGLKLNCTFGKDVYKADYEYFSNRDFFTDGTIHPIKKILGKMIYRIGMKALRDAVTTAKPGSGLP
jgi:multimeric flavodoxin WrbA